MAKSKEELIYDIENELVDPTTNKITGERVKTRLLDMVETMAESAGSGGGQLEYWAIPPDALEAANEIVMFAPIIKGTYINGTVIFPAYYASVVGSDFVPSALAIDFNARILLPGATNIVTIGEAFDAYSLDLADIGLVQINEETFYTI